MRSHYIFFTKTELQKLHLHFIHPNVRKLYNLIKIARSDIVNADTKPTLEEIVAAYRTFHEQRARPYLFCVSIPTDDISFNHRFTVDLMWLRSNPLLHIVDTQRRFQSAILLKAESARDVWDAFVEGWASVYIG